MTIFGVDYAWERPSITALTRAGVQFACRYLSHDPGKNLTRAEASALAAAKIWSVVVWETTAKRALAGKAAGAADATAALAQARTCGMPANRPIYFAVDWDVTSSQIPAVNAYLDGAASVLGKANTGIYGGYRAVNAALGAHCAWGWQTYAWSSGRWVGEAQLQQYKNDVTLSGVSLDYDRATKTDYGQWQPGRLPGDTTTTWTENLVKNLPTVKRGDQGEDVQTVQGLLKARSHDVTLDGDFGIATEDAVKAVQAWGKVSTDGVVGPATWPVLLRIS